MQQPEISIIIPVYNTESYLKKCLESVLAQTFRNIEVICINDGSTDSSASILKEYADKDPRLHFLTTSNNGVSIARNRALSMAQAPFIMFCDSDDYYEPNKCEKMLDTLKQHNVDVVQCDTHVLQEGGRHGPSNAYLKPFPEGRYAITDEIIEKLNVHCHAKIFKKELLHKYNIFFPEQCLYEDNVFTHSYFYISRSVYFLDEKLYHYRVRQADSLMANYFHRLGSRDCFDHIKICALIFKFLEKENLYDIRKTVFCTYVAQRLKFALARIHDEHEREFIACFRDFATSLEAESWGGGEQDLYMLALLNGTADDVYKYMQRERFDLYPVNKDGITVVFSSDNNYAPYLGVAIHSLLDHTSLENFYDIIIIDAGISPHHKERLKNMGQDRENVAIRFLSTRSLENNIKALHATGHVTITTYYRLFIADLLKEYDRVIYLDCDVILCSDIASLWNVDMEGNPLAAVLDIGVSESNSPWSLGAKEYLVSHLDMKNPERYFNSGVLVMDLTRIRAERLIPEFLRVANINHRYMHDQNVLNVVCENRWKELPSRWNFYLHMQELKGFSPQVIRAYLLQLKNKDFSIVHYITARKPWVALETLMAPLWWEYARRTPFYEEILLRSCSISLHEQKIRLFKEQQAEGRAGSVKLLKSVLKLPEWKRTYRRYDWLSFIMWGKRKKRYMQKKQALKQKITQITAELNA